MAALRADDPNLPLETVKERVRTIFVDAVLEHVQDFSLDVKAWHDLLMVSNKRTEREDLKTIFGNSHTDWMDKLTAGTDSGKYEATWEDHVMDLRRTWGARTHHFCKLIGHVF